MAVRLFNLRNVPDDEAEDIRELLTNNAIDYYETPAGNWGISTPSIWLREENQLDKAKQLIDAYQQQRSHDARAELARQKDVGENRRFIDEIKEHPARTLLYLGFALVILYFSTKPFIGLGQG